MKPVGKWSNEQIETARAMLKAGATLRTVGERFGVTGDTVKCKVDPVYLERRREQNNLNRFGKYEKSTATEGRYYVQRVDHDCLDARFAEIPRYDRRDLTGRLFGDPLIERSALYRKHLDRET